MNGNEYLSLLDSKDRIPAESWESEIIWDSTGKVKEGTEEADPETADSMESSSDDSDLTSVSQRVIAPSSGAFQVDLSAPRSPEGPAKTLRRWCVFAASFLQVSLRL